MKLQATVGALALCAAFAAHAQYKYIGPDGKVVYSDQPPPPNAKVLDKKALPSNNSPTADFPYALAQAVKSAPVTFYSAPNCPSCNDARSMLNKRGVPFTEKTVSTPDDATAFTKTINSSGQVPVLVVGATKLMPYVPDDWSSALTNAGYPAASQLPPTYRNPQPTNLAQNTAPAAPANSAPAAGTPAAPAAPAQPGAPAGDRPAWFKGF